MATTEPRTMNARDLIIIRDALSHARFLKDADSAIAARVADADRAKALQIATGRACAVAGVVIGAGGSFNMERRFVMGTIDGLLAHAALGGEDGRAEDQIAPMRAEVVRALNGGA